MTIMSPNHIGPLYTLTLIYKIFDHWKLNKKLASYVALCLKKKNQTFFDEDKVDRGDDLSPALLQAIEESTILIIILPKHYASSKWYFACEDSWMQVN